MSIDAKPWRNPRLAARIPELDGIRGLAILLVLVWHYIVITVQPPRGRLASWSLTGLGLTWSGVDLFFVLSGFLIGGILFDAKDAPHFYQPFYARRVHRIFIVYFFWIALFFAALTRVGSGAAASLRLIFNRDIALWSYPLFLQNLIMASHQTMGPTWTGITWSLAVEEQFYLLLPWLIRNVNYRGIVRAVVVSICCAPVVRMILWASGNVYYAPYVLLPSRADALGLGVLVALACRDERAWSWLESHRRHFYMTFFALGGVLVWLLKHERYTYTIGLTVIAAFYGALLLLALINPGRLERACLRNRLLVGFGTVSYSIYIFHQGINALFHHFVFARKPYIDGWTSLGVTALSLFVVIGLAVLSWRFIEKPLVRRAHARYRFGKTGDGSDTPVSVPGLAHLVTTPTSFDSRAGAASRQSSAIQPE